MDENSLITCVLTSVSVCRSCAKLLEMRCKMIRPVISKAIASRSIDQITAAIKRAGYVD